MRPSRSVSLTTEEATVNVNDTTVKSGELYLYKIVAFNTPFVDGREGRFIEVLFNGEQSLIRILNFADEAGKGIVSTVAPVTPLIEEESQGTSSYAPF
jgi:hypothetical protein